MHEIQYNKVRENSQQYTNQPQRKDGSISIAYAKLSQVIMLVIVNKRWSYHNNDGI